MGRANVYLSDDLERRVKAAEIPISEVCQRALLAAVEAAESGGRLDSALREEFRRGRAAGETWAATAAPEQLLTLLREQRFEEIPPEALPADLYSLTAEQGLAWEAGFSVAARESAHLLVPQVGAPAPHTPADEPSVRLDKTGDGPSDTLAETSPDTDRETGSGTASAPRLGDDAGARIGATLDGDPVSFDPHAAVRAGKSPLFAVLGQSDLRARLTISLAQDAAARGTAVVLLDVSGQLSSRARGLGKNVRVVHPTRPTMPSYEDLTRGAVGLGSLFEVVSGSGLTDLFRTSSEQLPPPGHVTVLDLAGDGGLSSVLALAHAAQVLGQLNTPADHPRLVQIDLPSTTTVPPPLAARLGRLFRTVRKRNTALGVSADSAQAIADLSGAGSLLSTVFAFATSNPVEADRLRDLLGSDAPILLNPPGAVATADDPTWVVMRDLQGRLGQVRLDAW
jgi:post-segregation antitoxin (ccd killing protein)